MSDLFFYRLTGQRAQPMNIDLTRCELDICRSQAVARITLRKVYEMLTLEELKKDIDLINEVEWDMTPEEAVKQYLEWGNTDWGSGKFVIRSKSDYTTYFVVNCWRKPYYIYLIRRNSEEALELAKFELPGQFEKDICELKGVYALDENVKAWLKQELGV
jgi:hypothetical protein